MKNEKIPILIYHEIADESKIKELSGIIQTRYIVEKNSFEKQLKLLVEKGFVCVTISELLYRNYPDNKKLVCITFDDGYEGNYTYAFPFLKKYGFKATFFIVSSWIDRRGMMTWGQINEMIAAGMEIGSHTKHHPLLGVSNAIINEVELRESMEAIKKHTGCEIKFISYPSGSYSRFTNEIAIRLGYRAALSSDFGYFNPQVHNLVLRRIPVLNSTYYLNRVLSSSINFLFVTYIKESLKKVTRFILGRALYDRLYFKIFNLKLPVEA